MDLLTRFQNPYAEAFTAAEEEKIIEMKAGQKSWKEIAAELNRSKSAIQTLWKEINPDAQGGGGEQKTIDQGGKEKGGGGKGNDNAKNDKSKGGACDGGQKKGDNKQEAAGKGDKNGGDNKKADASKKGPASDVEARFTMQEWMTLQEDDFFSFGELQCLSELIVRDERLRWLRIAGAFADTTGRRVHWEDIRDKFESMGG